MISLRKSVFACVLTSLLAVSSGTLAETMQEMRDSAGLKVEQSESLGGGELNSGVGNNTGDDQLDDAMNARCVDSGLLSSKMITNTCWTCIFPIIMLGAAIGADKDEAPADRVKQVVCLCNDTLGVPYPGYTYGFWYPSKLIEFVRMAGCLSALGGETLSFSKHGQGTWEVDEFTEEDSNATSVHYHYYSFPILLILNMFAKTECVKDHYADIDLLYMSEVDPTWYDDEICYFTNPESIMVANPIALLACTPEALSATALGKPIDSLFWCAGSWGPVYPFTTNIHGGGGSMRHSSLLTTRVLAALHRRFFLKRTYGKDAMCKSTLAFFIPKTQYKITMMYPVPEKKSAHVIGQSELFWGTSRIVPVTGEDPIYLIWNWNDCCMSMVQGSAGH